MKSILTNNNLEKIYISSSTKSITSLSKIIEGKTIVFLDEEIGHVQTQDIEEIDKYYDQDYHIYDESDEDDVIYMVIDGKTIFRQEHQVNILKSKINIFNGIQILDYGCAKGTVLKRLQQTVQGIDPYLFDVSQMYVHLWQKFLPESNYSSYTPKKDWDGKFDVVTSFFAFEHTPNPIKELTTINRLLKKEGYVYMIVPNQYQNIGDFIVADHSHHYSEISLRFMFNRCGFEVIEIDAESHFAAYIIIGKKVNRRISFSVTDNEKKSTKEKVLSIALYWTQMQRKIHEFEAKNINKSAAIYGAGVYGMFIASSLYQCSNIKFFVDQNLLLRNTKVLGLNVINPIKITKEIEVLYVGLNPKIAKSVIESLNLPSSLKIFYL